jgi:hypothetical protein
LRKSGSMTLILPAGVAGGSMLRDLKVFPLLDGYRGRPRAELRSVRDRVMRVGALVAAHPAAAELDLNPVMATPEGALVVDECMAGA